MRYIPELPINPPEDPKVYSCSGSTTIQIPLDVNHNEEMIEFDIEYLENGDMWITHCFFRNEYIKDSKTTYPDYAFIMRLIAGSVHDAEKLILKLASEKLEGK